MFTSVLKKNLIYLICMERLITLMMNMLKNISMITSQNVVITIMSKITITPIISLESILASRCIANFKNV